MLRCEIETLRKRLDALGLPLRQPYVDARRGDDKSVAYRGPEHTGQERIDDLDGGRGKVLLEAAHPRLNLAWPHRGERSISKRRVDVSAKVRLYLGRSGGPVDLRGAPLLGIGPERDPPGPRVEVGAAGQVRRHLG